MKAFYLLAFCSVITLGCIFDDDNKKSRSCEGVYSTEVSRELTYTLICRDFDDLAEITDTLSCSLEQTKWYTKYYETFIDTYHCDYYDDAGDIDEKCHINDWSNCSDILKNSDDDDTCENGMTDDDCPGYVEDCECKYLYDFEEDWEEDWNRDGDDYCGRFDDHFDEEYCAGLSIPEFERKYECTFYDEKEYESNLKCPVTECSGIVPDSTLVLYACDWATQHQIEREYDCAFKDRASLDTLQCSSCHDIDDTALLTQAYTDYICNKTSLDTLSRRSYCKLEEPNSSFVRKLYRAQCDSLPNEISWNIGCDPENFNEASCRVAYESKLDTTCEYVTHGTDCIYTGNDIPGADTVRYTVLANNDSSYTEELTERIIGSTVIVTEIEDPNSSVYLSAEGFYSLLFPEKSNFYMEAHVTDSICEECSLTGVVMSFTRDCVIEKNDWHTCLVYKGWEYEAGITLIGLSDDSTTLEATTDSLGRFSFYSDIRPKKLVIKDSVYFFPDAHENWDSIQIAHEYSMEVPDSADRYFDVLFQRHEQVYGYGE
ncbi:MAG: hypothetical protein OCC49_05755 [Fibrobacterales bacterium]